MQRNFNAFIVLTIGLLWNKQILATEIIPNKTESATLHISGASLHFVPNNQNQINLGPGLSFPIGTIESNHTWLDGAKLSYEFDVYNDSYRKPAAYGGLSFKKNHQNIFNYGLSAGLVTSNDLQKKGKPLYPAIVPFLETRFNSHLNLRVIVVPPWGNITNGELLFQFLMKIN